MSSQKIVHGNLVDLICYQVQACYEASWAVNLLKKSQDQVRLMHQSVAVNESKCSRSISSPTKPCVIQLCLQEAWRVKTETEKKPESTPACKY